MCHTSPQSYLAWALLSTALGGFLVYHLWSFDRFKCLKWNHGPYSGAFKRIMTYSYLLSVPLIMAYAIGFAAIKYQEGYVDLPFFGVIPKPYQLWSPGYQRAIFPLDLMFAIAWSMEMVTHLEELCFWLFLVNAGSAQQDWFKSLYFKTWVVGSLVAIAYMPLISIFTRSNPLKSEAYIFLAGSLGSLSLTLWFLPILWTFPSFLRKLKLEGVDQGAVVRLTKFHELNVIRVFFRLLFTVPLLILGADGVRPTPVINEIGFWTDILAFIAAVGCVVSSGITLVIFFPRSIEGEIASREARSKTWHRSANLSSFYETRHSRTEQSIAMITPNQTYLSPSPAPTHYSLLSQEGNPFETRKPTSLSEDKWASEEYDSVPEFTAPLPPIRPNRKKGQDVELGGIGALSQANLSRHNQSLRGSSLNPMVHNFTSPINMAYAGNTRSEASRLTFTRR